MVYYYQIKTPQQLGNRTWKLTHAPLLRVLFRHHAGWENHNRKTQLHYSNHRSPISNNFRTTKTITSKIFLAKLMRDSPYHPPTIALRGRNYSRTLTPDFFQKPYLRKLFNQNRPGKWYLKPENGHASIGIKVLSRPKEALSKSASQSYVLQKGIEPMVLYDGRKFEYRVWVLFVFLKGRFKVYHWGDSVMRVCSVPYQPDSRDIKVNITTSAHHYRNKEYKSQLLSQQTYFEQVYPKSIEICHQLLQKLKQYIHPSSPRGFEFMGFDFILQKPTDGPTDAPPKPVMIEINRNIGYYTYPRGVHHPEVVKTNYDMLRKTIKVAIEPLINWKFADPSLLSSEDTDSSGLEVDNWHYLVDF